MFKVIINTFWILINSLNQILLSSSQHTKLNIFLKHKFSLILIQNIVIKFIFFVKNVLELWDKLRFKLTWFFFSWIDFLWLGYDWVFSEGLIFTMCFDRCIMSWGKLRLQSLSDWHVENFISLWLSPYQLLTNILLMKLLGYQRFSSHILLSWFINFTYKCLVLIIYFFFRRFFRDLLIELYLFWFTMKIFKLRPFTWQRWLII